MNERITTCLAAGFWAAVLAGLGWPAVSSAGEEFKKRDREDPHIAEIEFKGGQGTFTHEVPVRTGRVLTLKFDTESEIQQVLDSLKLDPDHLLFVRKPGDQLRPNVTSLFQEVLGYSDKASGIKTETLWKKLLGRQTVLGVVEEGLSAEVWAALDGKSRQGTALEGFFGTRSGAHREIEGTVVGYAKASGQEPDVLRILADGDGPLIEIPRTAVVSVDVPGELADDLQEAIALLRAESGTGPWELSIDASKATRKCPEGTLAKISYQLPVRPWKAHLEGRLSSNGETMTVRGTAQICNDTPYDWTDVEVTLRTDRARYRLGAISLPRGKTNRFPITSLWQSHDRRRDGAATLRITEVMEVTAPTDKETDKIELPVKMTIKVSEGDCGDHIPPGELVVLDGRMRADCAHAEALGRATIPDDILPRSDAKGTKIAVATELVAFYTKKEEEPAEIRVEGYRRVYHDRRTSTFEFRTVDGRKCDVCCAQQNDGKVKTQVQLFVDGCCAEVVVQLGREFDTLGTEVNGNKLLVHEQRKSESISDLLAMSPADLTKLHEKLTDLTKSTPALADGVAILDRVIAKMKDREQLEKDLADAEAQLKALEEKVQVYTAEAQSGYHDAILRRFAAQIQLQQRKIAAIRNDLAVARYQLDPLRP
jgi:hypothetical protein